ncbi:MAG: hypothetical protein D6753_04620 [Planctomycetota bacterium]|nr:MAG: hypothetical protein D6753_04620 [Planctomycetota bacterium]
MLQGVVIRANNCRHDRTGRRRWGQWTSAVRLPLLGLLLGAMGGQPAAGQGLAAIASPGVAPGMLAQQGSASQAAGSGTAAAGDKARNARAAGDKARNDSARGATNGKTVAEGNGRSASPNAEDIAAGMAFVRRHQPRLAKLIDYLKERDPRQYERAMREVLRTQARLENIQKRDPQLHAIELELWKVRSEQQLVAAEAAAAQPSKRDKLESALLKLLEREAELEVDRLNVLRARAARQLEELDQQLQSRRSGQAAEEIQRRMKQWKSKIEREANQIRGKRESRTNDEAKGKQGDE